MDNNKWVAETIENEGLAYAIRHYCDSTNFKDRHTARLWDEAQKALDSLVGYLHAEGVLDKYEV